MAASKLGVIHNDYQGKDKRVLFVCSAGILRSATAARIYAKKYNTRCCGSHPEYALIPLSEELLEWAQEIVFVTQNNFDVAGYNHDLTKHLDQIKILAIPDVYEHMSPGLIKSFETQYEPIE